MQEANTAIPSAIEKNPASNIFQTCRLTYFTLFKINLFKNSVNILQAITGSKILKNIPGKLLIDYENKSCGNLPK